MANVAIMFAMTTWFEPIIYSPSESGSGSSGSSGSSFSSSSSSGSSSSSSGGRCGPDIGNWFLDFTNAQLGSPAATEIKTKLSSGDFMDKVSALAKFANLCKKGGAWDLKTYLKGIHSQSCPSRGCLNTVTFYGVCVRYDMPGNVFCGIIGRYVGISEEVLTVGADQANRVDNDGQPDPPEDVAAIDTGYVAFDNMDGSDTITSDDIYSAVSGSTGMAVNKSCKSCSSQPDPLPPITPAT